MNFEELFRVDDVTLQKNVDYQLEAFFLDIVENIHHEMKRTEMNQAQLAAALGVTPGRVSALMRGYKKNLSLRTITEIAAALSVEPQDLCARRKTTEMMSQPWAVADMATNPPRGDGHRNGAVHDRSQIQNPQNGSWTKRDTNDGRFIDQKTDGEPVKGARREKK
jgi:transcriptional regulator with XRE-family HTH domain